MSSRSGSEGRFTGFKPASAFAEFRCMGERVPSNYLQYNPPADWVKLYEEAERFSHNLPQLYRHRDVAVAAVQLEELW